MKSQKGYVQIVLIIFAVLIGLMIFPMKLPASQPGSGNKCVAGDPPTSDEIIRLAPPKYDQSKYYPATDEYINWGNPDPNNMQDYVLIRSNVLTPTDGGTRNWLIFGTNPLTGLAHSMPIGEDSQKPGFILYFPTSPAAFKTLQGDKTLPMEELVLFVNQDPATQREVNGKTFRSVDVYQKKSKFDDPNKGYLTEDLFPCSSLGPQDPPTVNIIVPEQRKSTTKDQLQLEWFLFERKSSGIWTMHCKPAVYLYPQQKQLVNVKVAPKGELVVTDPPYDKEKGWTVEAFPDGKLYNLGNKSIPKNYLYYESKLRDSEIKKPAEGWVVRFDELGSLYNKILPKLGLNPKEQQDFSQYWLKTLPKSPYYFVGVMNREQRDYLEPLTVTPNPDTSIRFSLYFEALDQPRVVSEPVINTPTRTGFTLVDWGGMIKLHPGTPFTCSQ